MPDLTKGISFLEDTVNAAVKLNIERHTNMNAHFVKLPSGNIINANLVTWFGEYDNGVRYQLANDGHENFNHEPKLTENQFLSILQPSSPIVSPVVDLDKLKHHGSCSFSFNGLVKHGVVESMSSVNGHTVLNLVSGGKCYQKYVFTGEVVRS